MFTPGEIAAIVVSIIVFVAIVVVAVIYFMKKKKPTVVETPQVSIIKSFVATGDLVNKIELGKLAKNTDIAVQFGHTVYPIVDGALVDKWDSGKHTLECSNNAPIEDAMLYCVKATQVVKFDWGTPRHLDVIDPMLEMPVRIGLHGDATIAINDASKVITSLVDTAQSTYSIEQFKGFFQNKIAALIKDSIAKAVLNLNVSYFEAGKILMDISAFVQNVLNKTFDEYGVTLKDFVIADINIPEDIRQRFASDMEEARRLKARGLSYQDVYSSAKEERDSDRSDVMKMLEMSANIELEKAKASKTSVTNIYSSSKKHCPQCNAELASDAVFCPRCGTKL